jgi:branched-chain amino acid transport system ATP-binding protein
MVSPLVNPLPPITILQIISYAAILLVEQNVSRGLTPVHRAYVLESGKVILQGTSAEPVNNKQVQTAHLGL